MVRQAVEDRGGHLGVIEDGRPFAEGEVGGDNDRGARVEPADEVEHQLVAGLGEWQIVELVEDDEITGVSWSASLPWRPARVSASSRLTRSTTLKNWPRAPSRMQARAVTTARWLLPVP